MLFLSAYLAKDHPHLILWFFAGVFLGAYISDLISYWVGRILGGKLMSSRFAPKALNRENIDKVNGFYTKYGMLTLILGRFIPFGVRNVLFMTAGLSHMNFGKFAFADFVACMISNVVYFTLYYLYGQAVVAYIKKSNIVIFSIAALIVVVFIGMRIYKKRRAANAQTPS
ncbi:DedA family protein [Myxococcota bacterium]|nr:DedA family protein [Myxococcota bacterium]